MNGTGQAFALAKGQYVREQILAAKLPSDGYFMNESSGIVRYVGVVERVFPLQNERSGWYFADVQDVAIIPRVIIEQVVGRERVQLPHLLVRIG